MVNYQVYIASISSDDPYYNQLNPSDIDPLTFVNQDNDFASVIINLVDDDFIADESGDQVKIEFSLNSKPMADTPVTIPLSLFENEDEIELSQDQITIESENWNQPELNQILLTGLDDFILDGDQKVNFVTGAPQSLDSSYDDLSATSATLSLIFLLSLSFILKAFAI